MGTDKVSMNILAVSPSWIGDVIIALPALRYLREHNRSSRLIVLAKPSVAPLWKLAQLADDIVVQKPGTHAVFETAQRLRRENIARAYIVPNSFRSALIVYLGRARQRIGFAGHWRRALLTDVVSTGAALERRHQVCEVMRLIGAPPDCTPAYPRLEIAESMRKKTLKKFGLAGGEIGIMPGAARGPSKCWPAEHYIALGRRLAAQGHRLAVFGGPGESDLCGHVADQIGDAAASFAGQTDLGEWAALLACCSAVVANDSGGMHLAAAVGCPVVAVFGITDPDKTGPRARLCRIVQKTGPRARDVPRESDLARKYLASIEPEAVYTALRELIAAQKHEER